MSSPFHWFGRLGNVIVLRLKRPANHGRTQDTSTTADNEGDTAIPTDLSNPIPAPMLPSNASSVYPVSASNGPGLQESRTGFPSSVYPFSASPAREASDIAQVALPVLQAITGGIPLAGTPINAAISGLLGILQVISRCDQNKVALDGLTSRLYRLSQHLCNAPPTTDPTEHSRRDILARKLQDTSANLRKLHKRRFLYASVTQAITGCSTDIDHYLMEYLLSSQMQMQHETHLFIMRRQERPQNIEQSFAVSSTTHLAATVALGCVTLVDATGHHHPIPVNMCASYQQLDNMLRVLFQRDVIEAKIQTRYIEEGQYDLCIDKGTEVTRLTSHNCSSIEPGTTIVMRVMIQQKTISASDVNYLCHFCGALNRLGIKSVKYEAQRQIVSATDCRECKRRFQITRRLRNPSTQKQRTRSSNSNCSHTTDTETRLIRNFHILQISEVRDVVCLAS
ncbi:hypothetical protein BDR07DRAFT_254476 [Suillus spraguei]|nr:hypothetical protein BDR07DRAFT_254476 [Suillus spraguei]